MRLLKKHGLTEFYDEYMIAHILEFVKINLRNLRKNILFPEKSYGPDNPDISVLINGDPMNHPAGDPFPAVVIGGFP